MSTGYSTEFVQRVRQSSRAKLGVRLGCYCIRHNISVATVSKRFKVSREAVYNWFRGKTNPSQALQAQVARFIGE